MSRLATAGKALRLLSRPRFVRAALGNRVAAAVEHGPAIRHSRAASLVDIGANKGQFSLAFRALRPEARIVAFEPLPEAADTYERLFAGDRLVSLQRVALAEAGGSADFHVTDRRDSSSLLKPGEGQAAAFGVRDELTITVPVKRLDECVSFSELPRPVLVKIDVQGGELAVLKGCDKLDADFVYVELSFVELYEGQPLFDEVADHLGKRGFRLAGVFNPTVTERFGPTQADFLFERSPG